MKKTLIIALCCIIAMMTACKKEPEKPTNYAEQYAGSYLGSFAFTILTMNNEAVTNMTFPIDNIGMDITKGEEINAITATVTVDNETRQTTGTASLEKAEFNSVGVVIDKPDQHYCFNLDLKLEGTKPSADSLNIIGTFTGNGTFEFMGETQVLDEISGTLSGKLAAQSSSNEN